MLWLQLFLDNYPNLKSLPDIEVNMFLNKVIITYHMHFDDRLCVRH